MITILCHVTEPAKSPSWPGQAPGMTMWSGGLYASLRAQRSNPSGGQSKYGLLRYARNDGEDTLRPLVRPHQIREPLEQIVRVARARRGLGVILHREHRLALELDAAI